MDEATQARDSLASRYDEASGLLHRGLEECFQRMDRKETDLREAFTSAIESFVEEDAPEILRLVADFDDYTSERREIARSVPSTFNEMKVMVEEDRTKARQKLIESEPIQTALSEWIANNPDVTYTVEASTGSSSGRRHDASGYEAYEAWVKTEDGTEIVLGRAEEHFTSFD